MREKLDHKHQFDPRVRVVGITDADLNALGRWPWRRDFHGEMVSFLSAAGADSIAFDLLFIEPSEDLKADQFFAEAVGEAKGKVVLGGEKINRAGMQTAIPPEPLLNVTGDFSGDKNEENAALLLPYQALAKTGKIGFVNADADSDGGRRELPLVEYFEGNFYPGLATQTLMVYWGIGPEEIEVKLGNRLVFHTPDGIREVPIDSHGKMIVNLRSPERFLEEGVVSYVQLYQALNEHLIEGKAWDASLDLHPVGRIFVFGQVAPGLADMGPSAFQPLTPLCYLQAQAVSNILQQDYVKTISFPLALAIWIVVTFLLLLALQNASLRASFFIPVSIVLGYILIAVLWFSFANVLVPLVWPIVGYGGLQFAVVMNSWQRERDARIATDASLQAAAEIQLATLPEVADLGEGPHDYDLAARLIPAQEASGDFFDFFMIDKKRLCLVAADVCDKGITAATFMLQSKTLLKAITREVGKSDYNSTTIGRILIRVNRELAEKNTRTMFATVLFGIYDTTTGDFEYSTAGHHPPLIRSTAGEVTELPKTGDLALGLIETMPYHSLNHQIEPGESMVLYTDGISEAFDSRGKMFGHERLVTAICESNAESSEALLTDILDRLQEFSGNADQSDDITAVVLTRMRT